MMALRIFGRTIDERFFTHRLRSTSIAGMAGAVLAGGIFLYRFYAQRVFSWELFAIIVTMAVVKMSLMIWYHLND